MGLIAFVLPVWLVARTIAGLKLLEKRTQRALRDHVDDKGNKNQRDDGADQICIMRLGAEQNRYAAGNGEKPLRKPFKSVANFGGHGNIPHDHKSYGGVRPINLTQIKQSPGACDSPFPFGRSPGVVVEWTSMTATPVKETSAFDALPTAKDLMKQIALKEAAKASESMRALTAEEAEKKALIDRLSRPSGVSDEDRLQRVGVIIRRAADNGKTEVEVGRFPNALCTDHGRAINQQERGWEATLTGVPKELYEFWQEHLRPRGYRLKLQIVDFPHGMPGDIGISLSWG